MNNYLILGHLGLGYHIPLIYSSTESCYGTNNLYPSKLFGWSKYAPEDYVNNSGGIALRYFYVYGPGEENKEDIASFVYQAFTKFRRNEQIKVFPNSPCRDFIYVNVTISANLHSYSNFETLDKRYYEVGSGENNLYETALIYAGIDFEYHDEISIPPSSQFYTIPLSFNPMNTCNPQFYLEAGIKSYLAYLVNAHE